MHHSRCSRPCTSGAYCRCPSGPGGRCPCRRPRSPDPAYRHGSADARSPAGSPLRRLPQWPYQGSRAGRWTERGCPIRGSCGCCGKLRRCRPWLPPRCGPSPDAPPLPSGHGRWRCRGPHHGTGKGAVPSRGHPASPASLQAWARAGASSGKGGIPGPSGPAPPYGCRPWSWPEMSGCLCARPGTARRRRRSQSRNARSSRTGSPHGIGGRLPGRRCAGPAPPSDGWDRRRRHRSRRDT